MNSVKTKRAAKAASCILFAATALLLPCMLHAEETPKNPARPNVLFIAVDDLRTALGCYGDTVVQSPNIDQLAASGLRFNRAYCHQAVCGPSRTSILTGRLPDNTRVWHNRNLFRETLPDLVTLPQLFKNNGYQALSMGKIFSGAESELDPLSWTAPEVLKGDGWKNYALSGAKGGVKKGAAYEAADVPDDGYSDGKLANLAVETLEKLKQDNQPFFLAVGFFKPHLPFNAPKKYWDLYDPAVFDLNVGETGVKGAPEIAYHTHRELGGYKDIPKDEHVSDDQARTLRHGYYACVSYTDAQIGKVLDALQRLGLDKNTIVVLWGDHGWALGEKGRWCKGTNFDMDAHAPFMMRVPGMAKGAFTEAIMEYVDVYPTLAELAGLTPPADLDGRSLVPILKDPQSPGRDFALSQFNRPWSPTGFDCMGYSIRTDTQRYTRWVDWPSRKTVAEELYDYSSPASAIQEGALLIEQENVAANPEYAERLDVLRAKMDDVLRTRTITPVTETPATDDPKPKKKKKKP
jgi:iduronate 2-sulfatase